MLAPLVLAVMLASEGGPSAEPSHPIGSFTVSAFSGFPDVIGGSAVLSAIPFVDVEGTVAFELFGLAASVRGGPRFTLGDWRDEAQRGWQLRLSFLAGARWLRLWGHNSVGPNVVGAIDATRWFARHFGLTIRFSGGAFYEIEYSQLRPDLRLGVGFSF